MGKLEKYQTELGGDDNTTAEYKCVAANLKTLAFNSAVECSAALIQQWNATKASDLEGEPDAEKHAADATAWVDENFVDVLAGNTTAQDEVKDCDTPIEP